MTSPVYSAKFIALYGAKKKRHSNSLKSMMHGTKTMAAGGNALFSWIYRKRTVGWPSLHLSQIGTRSGFALYETRIITVEKAFNNVLSDLEYADCKTAESKFQEMISAP